LGVSFGHLHHFLPIMASYTDLFVERKHKHIIALGLTLLHHASLPLKFWDSAFQTAVYLINMLPTTLQFCVLYT